MWIQAVAIILPRVQDQYSGSPFPLRLHSLSADRRFPDLVPDSRIGALSSSMFAGMMIGAIGWGTCKWPCFMTFGGADLNHCSGSDLLGRSMAFNGTLLFSSLFGLGATITTSFWSLCLTLFLLGSAVGVRCFTKRVQVREAKSLHRDQCQPTAR